MTSRFPTAAELLSFPPPNYVDPTTRRPLAIGIITPMSVLVVAFISCRFYCRTILTKTLGWDDGVMLMAAIMAVANNIMIIISMLPQYQMGYHLWDIQPQILYTSMKASQMGMATQLLFTTIITLLKVAILLTYLRIFPSRLNKWFCGIMLFYTVSLNVACFFVTLFQCSPASTYWNTFKYMGTAKCLNVKAIYYFHSAQNTFSDFLIFLWPAKDLLNVKVSLRQRVTLTCMFSLGVIVCVAGIARLYYTHAYLQSYDVFWNGAATFIIMAVESSVGIACGCLPGCKPLINRLFPQYFGTNSSSSQYPRRWQHNHAKQLDDGESMQLTDSQRSESIQPASLSKQPISTHRPASRQTWQSSIRSPHPYPPTLSRTLSHSTQPTTRTSLPHPTPSHVPQSTFTTTITAQPHLSRSKSHRTSRWGSADINKPLPMRPTPPAVAARQPSRGSFSRSGRASRELSTVSNASTEMFILQGREGTRTTEGKEGVWLD